MTMMRFSRPLLCSFPSRIHTCNFVFDVIAHNSTFKPRLQLPIEIISLETAQRCKWHSVLSGFGGGHFGPKVTCPAENGEIKWVEKVQRRRRQWYHWFDAYWIYPPPVRALFYRLAASVTQRLLLSSGWVCDMCDSENMWIFSSSNCHTTLQRFWGTKKSILKDPKNEREKRESLQNIFEDRQNSMRWQEFLCPRPYTYAARTSPLKWQWPLIGKKWVIFFSFPLVSRRLNNESVDENWCPRRHFFPPHNSTVRLIFPFSPPFMNMGMETPTTTTIRIHPSSYAIHYACIIFWRYPKHASPSNECNCSANLQDRSPESIVYASRLLPNHRYSAQQCNSTLAFR